MGYNLKNARNGKSASKRFEATGIKEYQVTTLCISENLEDLYGKCRWRALQQLFPYKSYSFKNSDGATNLAILIFSICVSVSGIR